MATKKISDSDVQKAFDVMRAEYYQDVRETAKSFAKDLKNGEIDDLHDGLHKLVDSDQRVIYTFQAKVGLLCSDNEDQYMEETGEPPPVVADSINYSALMYYAFKQDIIDCLESNGVHVNDPDSWADIDLKEFD